VLMGGTSHWIFSNTYQLVRLRAGTG